MSSLFSVIYRTGGTENFQWQRVNGSFVQAAAIEKQAELIKAGYPALVEKEQHSLSLGLPSTYEPVLGPGTYGRRRR